MENLIFSVFYYYFSYNIYIYIYWPSRLGLQNALTASVQRGKTPPMSVLIYDTKPSDGALGNAE